MFGPITHMYRLARAGRVIARHKVIPEEHLDEMPTPARLVYKIGGDQAFAGGDPRPVLPPEDIGYLRSVRAVKRLSMLTS